MNYTWFKIFNTDDFADGILPSKTYTQFLDGVGQKDVLVTKANYFGMTYEGVFLAVQMGDKNPYEMDGFAAYINEATGDVYLGIANL